LKKQKQQTKDILRYICGIMKFATLILVFLLIGTIFIPCADLEKDQSATTEAFSDAAGDTSFHFDFCSPLCSCHCCHSHVVTSMLSFDFKDFQLLEVHSFYRISIKDQTFTFWQPPKIS